MNDEQFKKAGGLRLDIGRLSVRLEEVKVERNDYDIPQEMFDRHKNEVLAFLQGEIDRLEVEFSSL